MQNSQMQNPFTKWVFNPLDQLDVMKNISWIWYPVLVVMRVSQEVGAILYWSLKNFYSSFSYGELSREIADDPFKETKKKCLPENIDHLPMKERLVVKEENSYFTCTPFTIEKRDGPSFSENTMPNLIIDNNNILMQLIFKNPNFPLPPGQRLMQVIEYRVGLRPIARKFQAYI